MKSLFSSPIKGLISLFLILYIFLFVYSPRLVSFNISHFLFLIAFVYITFNIRKVMKVLMKTRLYVFVAVILIVKLYSILIAFGNGLEIDFYGLYQLGVELPACAIFVIALMKKYSYKSEDLVTIIIVVGVIQTIIGICMLSSPQFKEIVDHHRYQFWDDRMIGLSSWRMYGFSDNMLHSTPIIQAVIALLILIRSSKKIILLGIIPFFFIYCAINTRTSVVVLVLVFALHFMFNQQVKRKLLTLWMLFLGGVICGTSLFVFMETNSEKGFEYLMAGYNAILDTTQGENSHAETFSSGYNSLPTNMLTLMVGVGRSIQGGFNYFGQIIRGDMGFVNDIWRYGVILSLLLWWTVIRRARYIKYSTFLGAKYISIIMPLVFLISEFKGTTIFYCDYMVLLILMSCSFILDVNIKNGISLSQEK